MLKPKNVLFVTWDGPQSSYLEGLFLPIFKLLEARGFSFHILQFTWGDKQHRYALKKLCENQGASYRDISILRRPVALGSLATAVWSARYIRQVIKEHGIDIVMPRSTIPALSAILALRKFPLVGLLFDADGLPHDERVDYGGWLPNGFAYRLLRDLEAFAIRHADGVLTRSKKAVDILVARAGAGIKPEKFRVVSNGRNEDLFTLISDQERIEVRESLNIGKDVPMVVFVGSSMSGKYCGKEMLEFFRRVRNRRQDARMLLLIGSPQEVNEILQDNTDIASSCTAMRVAASDVPRYLGASDLGLAFIRPSFSMQAAAAIKLGEYLLCGLPILTTRAIGDTDEIISDSIGSAMINMSSQELATAADWFIDTVLPNADLFRKNCRNEGVKNFGLNNTVVKYAGMLQMVAAKN